MQLVKTIWLCFKKGNNLVKREAIFSEKCTVKPFNFAAFKLRKFEPGTILAHFILAIFIWQ